jgi:hypothetical protein
MSSPASGVETFPRNMRWRDMFARPAAEFAEWVCVAGLVLLGAWLRLQQYFFNRSLWLDEAKLANNIIKTSVFQLLTAPLDQHQAAPPGFLLLEKIVERFWGGSELALRSVPLGLGILALGLAVWVGRAWWADPIPRLTFLGCVSFAPTLVYYSSELKQYIGDATLALMVMAVGGLALTMPESVRWRAVLAGLGAVAIWFSLPVVFLLAGFGTVLFFQTLLRREIRRGVWIAGIGLLWIVSFGLVLLLDARWLVHDSFLLNYWRSGFMPSLGEPAAAIQWLGESYAGAVYLAFQWHGIADAEASQEWFALPNIILMAWCGVGIVVAAMKRRGVAAALGMTILFVLFASYLQFYPFRGRLTLYFVPWIFAAACCGLESASGHRWLRWLGAAASLFILGWTLYLSIPWVIRPDNHSDTRQALLFMERTRKPGDQLIMSANSVAAFEYYQARYGLEDMPVLAKLSLRGSFGEVTPTVCAQAERNRIWVLFTEPSPNRANILGRLVHKVPVLDSYDVDGGGAYLFDFSSFSSCRMVENDS